METDDLSPEELKAILRGLRMMNRNMENWKYVSENAEYLDKKRVSDALSQMLSLFDGTIPALQNVVELEALTKLDPTDLI